MPEFLGREGSGGDTYGIEPEEWPDAVRVQMTSSRIDPALRGIIVRVEGIAPSPGYHSARLASIAPTPAEDTEEDRATTGFIELEFLAFPPIETAPAGPTSGRVLNAALFLPTRYLEDASAIRIQSAGTVTTLPLN